jgi:hypothetical protein
MDRRSGNLDRLRFAGSGGDECGTDAGDYRIRAG